MSATDKAASTPVDKNGRRPSINLLSQAIRYEYLAGAATLPDVRADLTGLARALRVEFGQCPQVIESTQAGTVARGREWGWREASGAGAVAVGWDLKKLG